MSDKIKISFLILGILMVSIVLGVIKHAPALFGGEIKKTIGGKQASFQVYKSDKFGFEVNYPKDYVIHEEVIEPGYVSISFTADSRVQCPPFAQTVVCYGPYIIIHQKVYPTGTTFADALLKFNLPKEDINKDINFYNKGKLQYFERSDQAEPRGLYIWDGKDAFFSISGTASLEEVKSSFKLTKQASDSAPTPWSFIYSYGGSLDDHGAKLEISSDGLVKYWHGEHSGPTPTEVPKKQFMLHGRSVQELANAIDDFYFNNQTVSYLQSQPDFVSYNTSFVQGDISKRNSCPYNDPDSDPHAGSQCRPKIFELQKLLSRELNDPEIKLK